MYEIKLSPLDPFKLTDAEDFSPDEYPYRRHDRERAEKLVNQALSDQNPSIDLADTQRYRELIEAIQSFLSEHTDPDEGRTKHSFGKYPKIRDNPLARVENELLEIAIRAASISPSWFDYCKRWTEKLIVALNTIAEQSTEIGSDSIRYSDKWPALLTPFPKDLEQTYEWLRNNSFGNGVVRSGQTKKLGNSKASRVAIYCVQYLSYVRTAYQHRPDRQSVEIYPISQKLREHIVSLPRPEVDTREQWFDCCWELLLEHIPEPQKCEYLRELGESKANSYITEHGENASETAIEKRYLNGIKSSLKQAVFTIVSDRNPLSLD